MRANLWLTSVLLVTLLPAPVFAQDRMARPGGPQPVQPGGPGQPQVRPARPGQGGPQIQPGRPGQGRPQIQPPRPGNGGPQIQPPRPGPNRPRPPFNGHRPGFHRPPHYRPPAYRYPHGYSHYRRWHIGAILPSILFGSQYYFHDYHMFGLYAMSITGCLAKLSVLVLFQIAAYAAACQPDLCSVAAARPVTG